MTTTQDPVKYQRYLKRRSDPDIVRRDAEQAFVWARESARAKRLTGGRLDRDPRRPWRGGRMAVDRNNLYMILHGIIDSPTTGERLAAMTRLEGTLVEGEAWFEKPHVITKTEIASRLDITLTGLRSIRAKRLELAGERTQRRMADMRWRTAVAAEAVGRKEAARLDHERAHVEKRIRREIWEHRQTLRRMAEARAQARRG